MDDKKFHSTETLLMKLVSDTYNAIDKDFGLVVIWMVCFAVFDTVNHYKFTDSIKHLGFHLGNRLNLNMQINKLISLDT